MRKGTSRKRTFSRKAILRARAKGKKIRGAAQSARAKAANAKRRAPKAKKK